MSKELVAKIKEGNKALFEASTMNIKHYFTSDLSKEELINHFIGRAANEYLNLPHGNLRCHPQWQCFCL